MRTAILILICLYFAVSVYAINSLVRQEDIPTMRKLGVSQEVIQYLISNQTSSVSSEDVIQMKKNGMTNDDIMTAIKSDLYRPEEKATQIKEAELIARLKEAGMSDEAILQFLQTVRTSRQVDSNGNVIKQYTNGSQRPPYPTTGATFPKAENYGYDPQQGRYFIFVRPRNR